MKRNGTVTLQITPFPRDSRIFDELRVRPRGPVIDAGYRPDRDRQFDLAKPGGLTSPEQNFHIDSEFQSEGASRESKG
jgi:hypothetical protein